MKTIRASINLRSKLDLIRTFINKVSPERDVDGTWKKYVEEERRKNLYEIIKTENLKVAETEKFVYNAFRDGELKTTGMELDFILPTVSIFGNEGERKAEKKNAVVDKLRAFYEKYEELYYIKS